MFFQVKSYLKFLFKSSNEHGVHSPFVYELITKCFHDKTNKNWYVKFNSFQKTLLKNNTKIKVEDFGAGSKKLHARARKISQITKEAGITKRRAYLLGRMINYFDIHSVLELGTSVGLASASMSLAKPDINIVTLEGCKNTLSAAQDCFRKFNLSNIEIITGRFDETLKKVLENRTYNLIYFDGNHQKVPTTNYFEQCLQHINNDSIFIFDDIYWSKSMKEAWEYIYQHPKVTVSIDTYKWGIVFFRKEQPKQHFVIRI